MDTQHLGSRLLYHCLKDFPKLTTLFIQINGLLRKTRISLNDQIQPMFSFFTFLPRDTKAIQKIFLANRLIRFPIVRSNGTG